MHLNPCIRNYPCRTQLLHPFFAMIRSEYLVTVTSQHFFRRIAGEPDCSPVKGIDLTILICRKYPVNNVIQDKIALDSVSIIAEAFYPSKQSTPCINKRRSTNTYRKYVSDGSFKIYTFLNHRLSTLDRLLKWSNLHCKPLIRRIKNLIKRFAENFFLRVSGQLLCSLIEKGNIVFQIHSDNTVKGTIHYQLTLENLLDFLKRLNSSNHFTIVICQRRSAHHDW